MSHESQVVFIITDLVGTVSFAQCGLVCVVIDCIAFHALVANRIIINVPRCAIDQFVGSLSSFEHLVERVPNNESIHCVGLGILGRIVGIVLARVIIGISPV